MDKLFFFPQPFCEHIPFENIPDILFPHVPEIHMPVKEVQLN